MSSADDNDKTRLQTKPESASQVDATRIAPRPEQPAREGGRTAPDDNTRFAPRDSRNAPSSAQATVPEAGPASRAQSSRSPAPDATVVATKGRLEAKQYAGGDATRIAPRASLSDGDKTHIVAPTATSRKSSAAAAVSIAESPQGLDGTPLLKNRFVFEQVIGTGGMGIVYKAKDMLKVEAQDRDPYVAIKVLSEEFKTHPEAFIALQRESRKTQRIAHPNIVNVYDFDRDGDTVFMTMEYMEGKPLDKLISQYRSTGLPPEDASKILEGISAALMYAHEQNIIHSDFKPGNIFVTENGTAKVFDFGIARAVAKAEHREESLEDKTVFDAGNLGALTPAYASLEMLEGSTPDVRDDLYALGCIAYEMFTGEHPYNRVHADEAQRQKLKPKRISGLTANQWKAIEGALALRRENRIATVGDFLRKLHQKKSHTVGILLGVLLLFTAVGATGYTYWPQLIGQQQADGDVRSEIEMQLRIEMAIQSVTELLDNPTFTQEWESQLWSEFQSLREMVGPNDQWLTVTKPRIFTMYLARIDQAIEAPELPLAERLITNAKRYAGNAEALTSRQADLAKALAEQKRLQQESKRQQQIAQAAKAQRQQAAQAEAVKKTQFQQALVNVESQLECRNHIDMEDFTIALNKLKSISAANYRKEEARIIQMMGQCIASIGEYFPERAEKTKQAALNLFNNTRTLAAIKIVPKDACHSSLAGLGASGMRATCRDILKNNQRGPTLVVTPASQGMGMFAIGKYEVTKEEYNAFCRQTSACTSVSGSDMSVPVTGIKGSDANAYAQWLSSETGRKYRLPTVGEWRYAAAAANHTVDPNRNCRLQSRGISRGNSLLRASVGRQNGWGLVNHVGNAREWAIGSGGALLAVGGSFESPMDDCLLTSSVDHSGSADAVTGFRVLREIPQ